MDKELNIIQILGLTMLAKRAQQGQSESSQKDQSFRAEKFAKQTNSEPSQSDWIFETSQIAKRAVARSK
jgi:hypothetical protein